jgi:hypothetical protein
MLQKRVQGHGEDGVIVEFGRQPFDKGGVGRLDAVYRPEIAVRTIVIEWQCDDLAVGRQARLGQIVAPVSELLRPAHPKRFPHGRKLAHEPLPLFPIERGYHPVVVDPRIGHDDALARTHRGSPARFTRGARWLTGGDVGRKRRKLALHQITHLTREGSGRPHVHALAKAIVGVDLADEIDQAIRCDRRGAQRRVVLAIDDMPSHVGQITTAFELFAGNAGRMLHVGDAGIAPDRWHDDMHLCLTRRATHHGSDDLVEPECVVRRQVEEDFQGRLDSRAMQSSTAIMS